MYAELKSFGIHGLTGFAVTVEADIAPGLPSLNIVGLPDSAVKESADRVRAAAKNLGCKWPGTHVTVNLAPADIKKTGPVYDLPVLLATLCASEQLAAPAPHKAFLGELSLDGALRPIAGVLPMTLAAKEAGITELYLPAANAAEAATCAEEGFCIYAVDSARQVLAHLKGECTLTPAVTNPFLPDDAWKLVPDFSDIRGQPFARRAMEIAASGGHNIVLVGPPGCGKSMLAKRLPGILPPLSREESIETTKIYSVAGMLRPDSGLISTRPFRSPHHSTSATALAGGGATVRPGEVSLAHSGVLFLDELPEFSRASLEVLRQPIEDGTVTVSRVAGSATYPSRFMLVAAMNGCRCGYLGHPTIECTCTLSMIERYRAKISGPILDRIDLHVNMDQVSYQNLTGSMLSEDSETVRARVLAARAIQTKRYAKRKEFAHVYCNADLSSAQIRKVCVMTPEAEEKLRLAFEVYSLSPRAYDRILRVARTIADMYGEKIISETALLESLQYRALDRRVRSK